MIEQKQEHCIHVPMHHCKCLILSENSRSRQGHISSNSLPDIPTLGSFNLAANKDMMARIWTNGDTITYLSRKHCGKRRNCSLRAISPFPKKFSNAVYC